MQVVIYGTRLYLAFSIWFLSCCQLLSDSESALPFQLLEQRNPSYWETGDPGILTATDNSELLYDDHGRLISETAAETDFNTHFIVFYFWGWMSNSSHLPDKLELVEIKRTDNVIGLYYDYDPPSSEVGNDAIYSMVDVIRIEKSEQFTWDGEMEVVVYYNDEEWARTSADFSASHSLFLPYVAYVP